jgi:hypothetical protein
VQLELSFDFFKFECSLFAKILDQFPDERLHQLRIAQDAVERRHLLVTVVGLDCVLVHFI